MKESKIKRALVSPFRGVVKAISPTLYVKLEYKYITKHKLNLKDPKRYTEKLQVLRLFEYPKNHLVAKCTSRDGVREYLKELGLEKYLISSLGVFDSFDEIDFDKLPNQFVLKTNHGSGQNIIVKDRALFDKESARKSFEKWLSEPYGISGFELHYFDIPRKIVAEKYLENSRYIL